MMAPEPALRLGLDLGTSALKAVAIDGQGAVVASGSAAYSTHGGTGGDGAEQSPRDWLAGAAAATRQVQDALGGPKSARIEAIGLAGQLPTLVVMHAEGPVEPAITWLDGRADVTAAQLIERLGGPALYRMTGMRIDGRYLAPMFRHHFAHATETSTILSAKDFLCRALTGRDVTDPSTAAGYALFDIAASAWSDRLTALWDIPPRLLPAIAPAAAAAGPLDAAGATLLGIEAGRPVGVGAADSVAAAFAMGALEPGTAVVVMGSSTVVLDSVDRLVFDRDARYILTPHALEGWWGREMDLLATGAGLRWLSGLLHLSETELAAAAHAAPAGARGVRFAPYLGAGEQGALWDSQLRGTLQGLSLAHSAGDIARAFLEGVALEIRRCLDVLNEQNRIRRVVIAGAMAEAQGLLQLLADALGLPVAAYRDGSPAAIGAALIAPGIEGLLRPRVDSSPVTSPGPDAEFYDRLYLSHCERFPAGAR